MSDQASETDTMIDPPGIDALSYREAHAFIDGVYCGVQGAREHEYGKEKHYWRLGWLLGDAYDRRLRES